VGSESYVVDIMRVKEVIRPTPVTPIRRGPRWVDGVINLRGLVIPIVSMRRRLGVDAEASTNASILPHQRIVILTVDSRLVGLVVDRVAEVIRMERTSIRPAPGLLADDAAPFFLGVCHHGGRAHVLLDVRSILATDDPIEAPALLDDVAHTRGDTHPEKT